MLGHQSSLGGFTALAANHSFSKASCSRGLSIKSIASEKKRLNPVQRNVSIPFSRTESSLACDLWPTSTARKHELLEVDSRSRGGPRSSSSRTRARMVESIQGKGWNGGARAPRGRGAIPPAASTGGNHLQQGEPVVKQCAAVSWKVHTVKASSNQSRRLIAAL